ncbi:MAG: arylsulfotransferase family protein [Thermoleophilaceae bacterium]
MRTRLTGGAVAVIASVACCTAAHAALKGQTQAIHSYPGLRVPVVTVTTDLPGTSAGAMFLTPRARVGERTGPMILDAHGRIVWFNRLPAIRTSLGLNAQTYRGKRVLTWSQRPPIKTDADLYAGNPRSLYNVIADDRYHVIARVRAKGRGVRTDLHDMVITKKGTALVVGFRFVHANLARWHGPRHGQVIDCLVQEIDIGTGHVLFSWSAIRHVALGDSYTKPPASSAAGWDFFHVNAVSEDIDGNLLVTARHTSAVYKVGRTTGRVLWQLGGRHSSFEMGPGTQFWYEHDAQRQPDGTLTVFDNHAAEFDKTHGGPTRVLRLALNTKKKTATLVGAYSHPRGNVLATSQGDARMVAGGNVFVGWGNSPWFSEQTPDGQLLFAAHLPSQTFQSYRVLKGDWHAHPDGQPVALAIKSGDSLVVYAAWNGATEIANWRVLAGTSAKSLQPVGSAPWNGLETRLRVQSTAPLVQVQALAAAGGLLGVSPVIRAR